MKRLICLVALPLFLVGCTMSFQNISTYGKATLSEDQSADVSPDVSIPAM